MSWKEGIGNRWAGLALEDVFLELGRASEASKC